MLQAWSMNLALGAIVSDYLQLEIGGRRQARLLAERVHNF